MSKPGTPRLSAHQAAVVINCLQAGIAMGVTTIPECIRNNERMIMAGSTPDESGPAIEDLRTSFAAFARDCDSSPEDMAMFMRMDDNQMLEWLLATEQQAIERIGTAVKSAYDRGYARALRDTCKDVNIASALELMTDAEVIAYFGKGKEKGAKK